MFRAAPIPERRLLDRFASFVRDRGYRLLPSVTRAREVPSEHKPLQNRSRGCLRPESLPAVIRPDELLVCFNNKQFMAQHAANASKLQHAAWRVNSRPGHGIISGR